MLLSHQNIPPFEPVISTPGEAPTRWDAANRCGPRPVRDV